MLQNATEHPPNALNVTTHAVQVRPCHRAEMVALFNLARQAEAAQDSPEECGLA
ncbi:hypothetical protein HA630_18900 [Aquabacterium sp. A08]|nr:hypothetical protein [Aquabacterium sp. A08]